MTLWGVTPTVFARERTLMAVVSVADGGPNKELSTTTLSLSVAKSSDRRDTRKGRDESMPNAEKVGSQVKDASVAGSATSKAIS